MFRPDDPHHFQACFSVLTAIAEFEKTEFVETTLLWRASLEDKGTSGPTGGRFGVSSQCGGTL